jgi:hypothetical protein
VHKPVLEPAAVVSPNNSLSAEARYPVATEGNYTAARWAECPSQNEPVCLAELVVRVFDTC